MKHWFVKLTALILAALFAFSLAVSGTTILFNINYGLYENVTLEEKQAEQAEYVFREYAYNAGRAALAQYLRDLRTQPDSVGRELWDDQIGGWYDPYVWPECEYTIYSKDGTLVHSTRKENVTYEKMDVLTQTVDAADGQIIRLGGGHGMEYPHYTEMPVDYQWLDSLGHELPGLDERTVKYDIVGKGQVLYRVEYFENTAYRVELHLTETDVSVLMDDVRNLEMMTIAYAVRKYDIAAAIISLLGLIVCPVYLCLVSGKKTDGEVAPRGLNRMPLDLYACMAVFSGALAGAGCVYCAERISWGGATEDVLLFLGIFGGCGAILVLIATLFLMALCAQVRMGGGAWYKRSLLGRFGRSLWNLCKKILLWAWGKVKALWNWACEKLNLLNYLRIFGQILKKLWGLMDMTWQWVIAYGGLLVLTAWVADTFMYHNGWAFLAVAVFGFPLVAYTAFAFGRLRKAAKRMSEGDLDSKIDTYEEFLFGHFAEFAEDLNTLSDTCIEAAMEKMKSERMKTELITNVSHDIKTPLTSIINYVDLLKTAKTEAERQEYLEVLDRQSLRLKKLIEDLMEMSKATTGNITAELTETDVVEAVNQALGEFADRLDALNLNVVFRQKDQSIYANCDGKLLWRVLSNLLVNVVKYTLPGTRVYVDVTEEDRKVRISLKNISKEPLNIPVEELMERFVRGDESRTDQGNGLGLNIAQGLMEVQHGTLDLTVDGDLFKVTLTLNR